jgi:pimeloyl-ACP methyl ester carboxylesterase
VEGYGTEQVDSTEFEWVKMNEGFVDVNGTRIAVRQLGTGPPVLFIHGLYVNEHLWDEVAALTSSARTCYLPTLPLGGHSIPVGTDWRPTLDDLAGLVTGLIQELDLEDVTIVGNDTGGGLVLLALGSGHAALERVSRVVLTNCDSYDHLPPPAFGPFVTVARRTPFLAKSILRLLLSTGFGRKQFLASVVARDPSPYIQALFNPAHLDEAVKVTAALRPSREQQEMRWLETLDLPVHLVWGEQDYFFPVEDAERLRTAMPSAGVTRVPGAKTYVPLDNPAEVYTAIVGLERVPQIIRPASRRPFSS